VPKRPVRRGERPGFGFVVRRSWRGLVPETWRVGANQVPRRALLFPIHSDDSTEQEFRVAYRAFVDAFRAGALRLRERAREIRDLFPVWAFPPQLPFRETA